jgi:hypothetical protein
MMNRVQEACKTPLSEHFGVYLICNLGKFAVYNLGQVIAIAAEPCRYFLQMLRIQKNPVSFHEKLKYPNSHLK